MKQHQEKENFENITTEQIAYGIQCNQHEINRLLLLERKLAQHEEIKLKNLREKVAEARKELQKRTPKQGKLF